MKQRLLERLEAVDALSLRERIMVAAAAALVVWGAWTLVSWDAVSAAREDVATRIEAARSELAGLSAATRELSARAAEDPDAAQHGEIRKLEVQIAELEARRAEHARHMISPVEMVNALREILDRQDGLVLEHLELLAPESALVGDEQGVSRLYRHTVRIELSGDFATTLRYLRAVEALDWSLYWESLDYQVLEHPQARVRLHLYTLNEQEGWLGV